jgi:hypothetical protein
LKMHRHALSLQFQRFNVKLELPEAIEARFHAYIFARLRRRAAKTTLKL